MQAALYSLTAAESAGKVMGDSLMTALIGVVVVFATLVVLTLIFIHGRVCKAAGADDSAQEQHSQMPALCLVAG